MSIVRMTLPLFPFFYGGCICLYSYIDIMIFVVLESDLLKCENNRMLEMMS